VVASTKAALATLVRVSAVTKVTNAVARQTAPNSPFQPSTNVLRTRSPWRNRTKPAATGITNRER
jgi:hypothetical protein